ncbi:hypothetical protein SAMN05661080_01625 [Modestobacter sp. DSM 44400]|nr:hypothetical protein SAMN05661080_01625 [Modestobacter sp. DSM 44400]
MTSEQRDALLTAVDDARNAGLTVEVGGDASPRRSPSVVPPRRSVSSSRWSSWPSPSQATEQLGPDLRALLADGDGPLAYVTGQTAVSVDVATTLDDALPVYLVLVVGLALV